MKVKPNPYLEEWASYRENLEKYYRYTPRRIAIIGIFGFGVPALIYKGVAEEAVRLRFFFFLFFRN